MIGAPELGAILRSAKHDLFRMETLDYYESDGGDYQRYLAGEPEPDMERVRPWLERLRAEKARGLHRRRVHVVRSPVPSFVAYEADWGYTRNAAAGEDIRILDLAERPLPRTVEPVDFWVVDRQDIVVMHYGAHGQFLGADPLDMGQDYYLAAMDAAWEDAEPFASWWDRHPEYHRDQRVA